MSLMGSPQWGYSAGGDYTIDQSLRFEDGNSPYLSFTPAAAGNRRTWTWSAWVKRGNLTQSSLFATNGGGSDALYTRITFHDNDSLMVTGNNTVWKLTDGTQYFRDTAAWYHIVVALDTTQGTASNRLKMYVNGSILTSFSHDNAPDQNEELGINNATQHHLGSAGNSNSPTVELDGYLAEVNFLDGVVATPADFGETDDDYGHWKPKQYSGSYGTNGFYLPFKADYTVEGFNTVTWNGTSANQYVGGVGFQPDFLLSKRRSGADNGMAFDSVRGVTKRLLHNAKDAEATSTVILRSFDSDGFTVGTDGYMNYASGHHYVAWCWDMGGDSYGVPSSGFAIGGNLNHSTTQKKIGATSIRFDGSDDFFGMPDSDKWDFGTKDFTIEAWVRFDALGSKEFLFSRINETTTDFRSIYIMKDTDNTLVTRYGTGNAYVTSENASTETLSANTWYHIAVTRSGNSFHTYLNGSRLSSMDEISTVEIKGGSPFYLGAQYDSAWNDEFTGYMDEVRISNKCRYTSNFTAPTTAFSNDANTLFLLHSDTSNGSTTFVDSSGATPNTDGSITSYVAANTTYGQSVVSWTGSGANATVGHGLSSAPDLVIYKNRDDNGSSGATNGNWIVQSSAIGADDFLLLNDNSPEANDSGYFNGTRPSSSVLTLGAYNSNNGSSDDMIAYCFHNVTGYSSFGSYTGNGSTTGPTITTGFAPAFVMIKVTDRTDGGNGGWFIYDNTRSPHISNNNVLAMNSTAAELVDNSNVALDFLSNGFQLKASYDEVNVSSGSYIYAAFADKREYAYWLDQSGNNNDWASNNLTESDISVDSPTNNFATFNPVAFRQYDGPFYINTSHGNLKAQIVVTSEIFGNMFPTTGKWYCELLWDDKVYDGLTIGLAPPSNGVRGIWNPGVFYNAGDGQKGLNGSWANYGLGAEEGDIIGIAWNFDDSEVIFSINGVSQGTITSALTSTQGYGLFISGERNGYVTINHGQDSSFAGAKTSQGNQDANEIGDFYYTPTANHLALCTSNLPDVAVKPQEHFNTLLYTGDGNSTHAVTGVGFQPDFIWFKHRTGTYHHSTWDAVRGVHKQLYPSGTNAEADESTSVKSFDTDGFTLGSKGNVNDSAAFVAWNWKVGGSGSANTNGSINTSATSVNTDAGISIGLYTGNATSGATVGHGLSKVPEMIVVKKRNATGTWATYHSGNTDAPETEYVTINTNEATTDQENIWNDTAPTSTVFSLGNNSVINGNTDTFVYYAFHSVEGYSKVGSYLGNGLARGTFVYTGFRVAWLLVKETTDAGEGWYMFDNKRDTKNYASTRLMANNTNPESTGATQAIDLLSNGFKARANQDAFNTEDKNYIFLAFAETPLKYANAR